MAKRKRESSAASPTPQKAKKRAASKAAETNPSSSTSVQHPHGKIDAEKEYKVREIIGENKRQYHIAWEDDSDTGEAYPPTWEPKENANDLAIADWEEKKATKNKRARGRPRANSTAAPKQLQHQSPASTSTPVSRPKGRPRKQRNNVIVESSSDLPSTEPEPVDGNGVGDIDLPEIGESQQSLRSENTLTVQEIPTAEAFRGESTRQLSREPTVLVPDPPSSYDRGSYHKIQSRSSSNKTSLGFAESSAPLPTISEAGAPSSQQDSEEITTRVVPDSQSQYLEESTFRGFSPTQLQLVELESNVSERIEQRADNGPTLTENASQTARSTQQAKDSPEAQTSGGAERADSPGEDRTEAVSPIDTSVRAQLSTEESSAASLSVSQPTQPHSRQPTTNFPHSTHDRTAASAIPLSVKGSPARPKSASPGNLTQEHHQQAFAGQEKQLEESYVDSQADLPGRSDQQQQNSTHIDDYIVISAEEDQPSTLDLLTQPDYSPPPSSLFSENFPQTKGADGIDTSVQRTDVTLGSTQSSFPFETQQPYPTKIESESRQSALLTQRIVSPHSSSQIPSVPSQSIVAIGESAPARLATPSPLSTATMEPNSSSGNPLLEKLNAVLDSGRARRKARRSHTPAASVLNSGQTASAIPPMISAEMVIASQARQADGARSPSTVPASEPERIITKEEMRTSGRLPTLVPLANGAASELQHNALTVSESSKSAHDDPEQVGVRVVPVAFGNIQRDSYKNGTQWYQGEIQRFVDGDDSPELYVKAEEALGELRLITMHPDLINSEACFSPASTPEQAQWDLDASCKFRFLRDILDQLRSQNRDLHVVVTAKGHIVAEMLVNFLRAKGIQCARLTVAAQDTDASGLRVSILDLDVEVSADERADVVVAMNGICSAQNPSIQAARRSGRDDDWAPLLILVAPCTVEHIERSLLPNISNTTRVRTLLKTALNLQLQEAAGRLTPGQAPSQEAAAAIASFLASPADWPIEELGIIDNLDSQTETDIDPTPNGGSSSGGKRSFDGDIDILTCNPVKKPRVSSVGFEGVQFQEGTLQMPATINPQDIELTHISDSIGKATQSALDETVSLSEVEQLRRILSNKQYELQEHVKEMSDLQYRHEAQHVELAKTKNERDEAIITAQNAVTRMSLAADQSAELRLERTELKRLLAEANSKLLDHAVPERREFETLRLALEHEKAAKEKAEKRFEQAQKDGEYSREMYQNTSSRARDLVQQNADLESRLSSAEKHASGEQAKVQQATNTEHHKILAKENKKLKALLKDREAGMKSKDEEITRLKEAGRGRIGTRGSSVPRSPRMASPALKGRNSRQTSPTTGEVKGRLHPLRNG